MEYSNAGRHTTASRHRPSHYDYDDPRKELEQLDDVHRRHLQYQVQFFSKLDIFCLRNVNVCVFRDSPETILIVDVVCNTVLHNLHHSFIDWF